MSHLSTYYRLIFGSTKRAVTSFVVYFLFYLCPLIVSIQRKVLMRTILLIKYAMWICLLLCRYGPWRWPWEFWQEEKGRGRHLSSSIWFGHLQDARKCVDLGQSWSGPGEIGVAFECGRFMAKAIKGPAPWLQLLHGDSEWLKPQLYMIQLERIDH